MTKLSNALQEHLGFMLLAKVAEDYTATVGQWESDCVFIALPNEAHLFNDPGYLVLADHDHRTLGEHRVTIINDGTKVSYNAVSSDASVIYISIPLNGLGEWGVINGGFTTKLGCAQFPTSRSSKEVS